MSDRQALPLRLVVLHVSTLTLNLIFELAAQRLERIAQRHVHVFVGVVSTVVATDDDFPFGHGQIDADPIRVSLVLVVMRRLNHDLAASDAAVEVLELLHLLGNASLDGLGAGKTAVGDL